MGSDELVPDEPEIGFCSLGGGRHGFEAEEQSLALELFFFFGIRLFELFEKFVVLAERPDVNWDLVGVLRECSLVSGRRCWASE